MSRFREAFRFREGWFSGYQTGIYVPPYVPLEKRGYKIIFYDALDNKLGEVGSDILSPLINIVEWEIFDFGCGGFRLVTDDRIPFSIGYRTRIDIFPYFSSDAWYSGFVMEMPQKSQVKKPYEYSGYGYYDQLDWVLVTKSYTNTNLSDIIKDIVSTMVAPKTHIKYNADKIASVSVVVASINFDHVYAKDALRTLSNFVTNYEFGVDAQREFYFRAKAMTARKYFWATKHFSDFWVDEDIMSVKNRLYVKAGHIVGGSNIIGSVEDSDSIAAYGVHEDVITAPEILTTADAFAWAVTELERMKVKKTKAEVKEVFLDEFRTPIAPEGKAVVTDEAGAVYELPIKSVKYSISPKGIFVSLNLET